MAIDWLTAWGIAEATSFVFKPILEDLAKDVAKDGVKDYVKGCFGNVFSVLRKEPLQRALGKALRHLLVLIHDELLDSGLTGQNLHEWIVTVGQFTRSDGVQQAIRQAFTESDSSIDPLLFAQSWQNLPTSRSLPNDFSWDRIAKRFTRAVYALREEDAELRDILRTQAAVETARAARQQVGLTPDFDLETYRHALLERYAQVHFDTLDTIGAFYYNVKLWSIFVPQTARETHEYYPQLLEVPKEHLRRMRERGELDERSGDPTEEVIEERRQAYLTQVPRPVLEVIDDGQIERLMVLGDPGSGKSSLLQYLALQWARAEDVSLLYAQPLPLLIEFREYDRWHCPSGKSFVRYLHEASTWHRLNQYDLDRRLREQGAVVLLLDGLDEIFDSTRREHVINDIHRFSNEYPQTKIIATSRVIGYKPQRLADAEFRHFMLQDLDDSQIADFLTRWHDTTVTDERDRQFKKERLTKALHDSPAIHELAGNPLLLTMMSILNRNQELPRDRAQLYQQASRVLLHEWDTERTLESYPQLKGIIGYPEKAEILREVANFMQSAPAGLAGNILARTDLEFILRDYLQQKLGFQQPHAPARDVVNQLRERNFILCYLGADSYAFVHRTFLEYFCASAIVNQFRQKLSLEFLKNDIFGVHYHEESWQEVLCLIAGLVAESSAEHVAKLIEFLLGQKDREFQFHHILLAARCYLEVRNPTTLGTIRSNVIAALEKLLRLNFPYNEWNEEDARQIERNQASAVALLAHLQFFTDPCAWLKDQAIKINDIGWQVRQAAVRVLTRGWRDHPETLSWLKDQAINSRDWGVRQAAVEALAQSWRDHPEILPLLKDRVVKDEEWRVRQAAVKAWARGWRDHPETLSWLKDRAINDPDSYVRQAAVEAWAQGWRDHPETLSWLKDRAINDPDSYVRHAAVEALARGWRDHPEILPLLQDRAVNDPDPDVRQAAVKAWARGWRDHPKTLLWLKDRAINSRDSDVRQAAVEALAQGWRDHPEILPLLQVQTVKGEGWGVRRAAVEALAQGWRDHPETLPFLQDQAIKNEDWRVRQAAVTALARYWRDHSEILLLLKDRVVKDECQWVYQAAMEALTRYWRDHAETLPFLQDRAVNDPDADVRQAAVRVLARYWRDHAETLPFLQGRAVKDEDWRVRLTAMEALAQGWRDHAEILPFLQDRAVKDEEWRVRLAMVQELIKGWRNHAETLPLLQDRAVNDPDLDVRQAAVEALAQGWRDHAETLPLLQDRAVNDPDSDVRQAAVKAVAPLWGWRDHADEILPWLQDRAVKDEDWRVRLAAMEALAQGWRDHVDETLPWLQDRAVKDEDWRVRLAAMEALAQGWRDHVDETLPWLQDRAVKDEDVDVRSAAVWVLAQGWQVYPETLSWLKDRAIEDEEWRVRLTAVEALAQGWRDHAETLPFLQGRAVNDGNKKVRQAAIEALALSWRDHAETLPFLQGRAVNDPNADMRLATVEALAQGWREHAETLPFLQDRAVNDPNAEVRLTVMKMLAPYKLLPFLQDRAVNDPDMDVRSVAVVELTQNWRDDPETLAFLRDRAVNGPDVNVRSAAVWALAQGWHDRLDILSFIKGRAVRDEDGEVRQAVVRALAWGWRGDSEILL